jgi:hypothetical protein
MPSRPRSIKPLRSSLCALFFPCSDRPRTTKLLVGIPPLLRMSRSNPALPRRSAPSYFSQSFPQDPQLLPDLVSPFIPKQIDDLDVTWKIPTLATSPADPCHRTRTQSSTRRTPSTSPHPDASRRPLHHLRGRRKRRLRQLPVPQPRRRRLLRRVTVNPR